MDNNSLILKIKANKKIILIAIVIILVLIVSIIIFSKPKNTPKTFCLSFIEDLQNYDYDKVSSYIDFDRLVMLKETYNDIENLESNLASLTSKTENEQGNFKESISYTKRHFEAVVNELKINKICFVTNQIELSKVSDNIYKVIIDVLVQEKNSSIPDKFTFFVKQIQDKFDIISVSDEKYF